MSIPVKDAILSAYAQVNLAEVERISRMKLKKRAAAAKKLLEVKAEHPTFEVIDYWWLDDLVEKIEFGQHSYTASDLKLMGDAARIVDDRIINITWRCGMVTTVPSGVVRDSHDPRHKAKLWDGYILRYPDRYPKLAEEVRKKRA